MYVYEGAVWGHSLVWLECLSRTHKSGFHPQKLISNLMGDTCNPSDWEDQMFKVILGNIASSKSAWVSEAGCRDQVRWLSR